MRHIRPLLIFLLLLLTASPQIAPAKTGAKTGVQTGALAEIDAKLRTNFPQVESISAADLQARMDRKDAPVILDVREKDEFAVSHLQGAIRVDPNARANDVLAAIGPQLGGRDVVFYCSVGVRSTKLAVRMRNDLQQRGAARIINLSQGIFGWHNSARPLARALQETPFVHPYNLLWGQLVTHQNLAAYVPVLPGQNTPKTFFVGEAYLRLGAFLGIFALLALAETLRPRRPRIMPRTQRWLAHFGMLGLATLLVRIIIIGFPLIGATAAALFVAQQDWGLFHALHWPGWLEALLAILLLDFAIWAQHVITHNVPLLWRLHRVHHADRDLDASSALRFHPFEILFSALYKLVIILALGPAIIAVIAFEILLNASAMFNHANLALPLRLDALLRLVIVTPDMHRIHHSATASEQERNFGFCLSIWDRIFATYKAAPDAGQADMIVGLQEWQSDNRPAQLAWSLGLPFRK